MCGQKCKIENYNTTIKSNTTQKRKEHCVCSVCICHHRSLLDGPEAVNEDVHPGLNWDA